LKINRALKNPRVSQSAKEHARQVLDQEYEGGAASSSDEEKKPTNVIRGLKAYGSSHPTQPPSPSQSSHPSRQSHQSHLSSSFPAHHLSEVKMNPDMDMMANLVDLDVLSRAIHNPNVTDYGKMQARKKMEDMGVEPEQPGD